MIKTSSNTEIYTRAAICQAADRIGYIPLVGTVVGAVRIVASLVVSIFAGLALIFAPFFSDATRSSIEKHSILIVNRSAGEANRGFIELIPFASTTVGEGMGLREDLFGPYAPRIALGRSVVAENGGAVLYFFKDPSQL